MGGFKASRPGTRGSGIRRALTRSGSEAGRCLAWAAVDGVGGGAVAAPRGHARRHQVAGPGSTRGLLRGEAQAEGEGGGAGPGRIVQGVACGVSQYHPGLRHSRPRTAPHPVPPEQTSRSPTWGIAPHPQGTDPTSSLLSTPTPHSPAWLWYPCWRAACIWAPGRCAAPRWGRGAGAAAKDRPRRPNPLARQVLTACNTCGQKVAARPLSPNPQGTRFAVPLQGRGSTVSREPGKQTRAFPALGVGGAGQGPNSRPPPIP